MRKSLPCRVEGVVKTIQWATGTGKDASRGSTKLIQDVSRPERTGNGDADDDSGDS